MKVLGFQDMPAILGDFPSGQWLRLQASTAGGVGSIPGQGTKIPHDTWLSQKKKKKNRHAFQPLMGF